MTRDEFIDEQLERLGCGCDQCRNEERLRLGEVWDAAVAAERERCAKALERMAAEAPGPQGPGIRVLIDAGYAAAKIRSGE